jgi:hypothetical protein
MKRKVFREIISFSPSDISSIDIFREMAYPKDKIINKLMQFDDLRLEHLLKLYYYKNLDNKDYVHTWINSVYKGSIRTYKDDSTNKWPEQSFLYENLWLNTEDAYKEHHNGFLETFLHKGFPEIENPDIQGSANFCASYFRWLSQKWSEKGEVTLPEVEEKILSLLDR